MPAAVFQRSHSIAAIRGSRANAVRPNANRFFGEVADRPHAGGAEMDAPATPFRRLGRREGGTGEERKVESVGARGVIAERLHTSGTRPVGQVLAVGVVDSILASRGVAIERRLRQVQPGARRKARGERRVSPPLTATAWPATRRKTTGVERPSRPLRSPVSARHRTRPGCDRRDESVIRGDGRR